MVFTKLRSKIPYLIACVENACLVADSKETALAMEANLYEQISKITMYNHIQEKRLQKEFEDMQFLDQELRLAVDENM